jgi:hypothetical protein
MLDDMQSIAIDDDDMSLDEDIDDDIDESIDDIGGQASDEDIIEESIAELEEVSCARVGTAAAASIPATSRPPMIESSFFMEDLMRWILRAHSVFRTSVAPFTSAHIEARLLVGTNSTKVSFGAVD